MFSYYSKQW